MIRLRRVVPLDEVPSSMRNARAVDQRRRCRAVIVLDGRPYRCERAHVDGIHDAMTEHGDGGAVRW